MSFRAPYPVTNADEDYSVMAPVFCPAAASPGKALAPTSRAARS